MAHLAILRDQENLIHGAHTAAVVKSQNQPHGQLPPKTPGLKAPKTPAPGTRAILGQKTTNAKAKTFQTPGLAGEKDLAKLKPLRTSVQKAAPRPARTEAVKLNVLQDAPLEEQEIEYMPPRGEALPDPPEDIPADFDLSMFDNNKPDLRQAFAYYKHVPDASGVTLAEREQQQEQRDIELDEQRITARIEHNAVLSYFECFHDPECSGECVDRAEHVRKAEEKFQCETTRIEGSAEHSEGRKEQVPAKKTLQLHRDGPIAQTAKSAAAALAMPHTAASDARTPAYARPTQAAAAKSAAAGPNASRKIPPPSLARSTAAPWTTASRSTMGYAKGRATSLTLRAMNGKTDPQADSSKANVGAAGAKGGAGYGLKKKAASKETEPNRSLTWLVQDLEGDLNMEDLQKDVEWENAWLRENADGEF